MRHVLHCQRELPVLLRTEVSGTQTTVLSCKHMGGLGQASTMHRGLCKNSVVIGLGMVLLLIKNGICWSVCGVYGSPL